MPEVTIKPADPIVPGRPSWIVCRNGEFVARVWEDAEGDWAAAAGDTGETISPWNAAWAELATDLDLPANTPEPTPAPEVETVEVRVAVVTHESGAWSAHGDSDMEDGSSEDVAVCAHDARDGRLLTSILVGRVPLPAKPAEIVGEVAHADD